MSTLSFRCMNCLNAFVSKSSNYRTAEKELHRAGWIDVEGRNHGIGRLCPDCQKEAQRCESPTQTK